MTTAPQQPSVPAVVTAAAQSPDPALRALAARRLELAAEVAKLDTFFDAMHTLTAGEAMHTLAEIEARLDAGTMPKPQFVAAVRDILVACGQPLQPAALFVRFAALYPAFATGGSDALRKRMHGMKEHFVTLKSAGYWPADLPLPAQMDSSA